MVRLGRGLLLGATLLTLACRTEVTKTDPDASLANLMGVHSAYSDYVATARKAPQSLKDLEKAFPEDDRASLDARFRSPHDGKTYTIIWGIMLAPNHPSPPAVLAHEETGKNGERWVLMTDGKCKRLNQADFDTAKKAR